MTEVIHVVGTQGVGKSTLVESMSARDAARGRQTGHVLADYGVTRAQALAMFPAADVVYLEHLRREDAEVEALPRDLVILLERVGEGA